MHNFSIQDFPFFKRATNIKFVKQHGPMGILIFMVVSKKLSFNKNTPLQRQSLSTTCSFILTLTYCNFDIYQFSWNHMKPIIIFDLFRWNHHRFHWNHFILHSFFETNCRKLLVSELKFGRKWLKEGFQHFCVSSVKIQQLGENYFKLFKYHVILVQEVLYVLTLLLINVVTGFKVS